MTQRGGRQADPLRASALAEAAAKVFAAEGFHRATVAQIARGAGVATGTFYLYYPSKENCLLTLIGQFYSEVLADVRAARRAAPSELDKFRASVLAVLSAFGRRTDLATIVLLRGGGTPKTVETSLRRIEDELWHLLAEDLTDGMALGVFEAGNPRLQARLVMGAISDALIYGLSEGSLGDAGELEICEFIMRAVTNGNSTITF